MALLLTNDDGVDAPGLAALAEALAGLDELVVSAPAANRSGVGMGITLGRDIRVERRSDGPGNVPRYAIDGTPADAVKYGLQHALGGRKPRLVVSGINLGPNLGINVRCSGTVGAAFEAVVAGIPAVAVSVDYVIPTNWDGAKHFARVVAEQALSMFESAGTGAFMLNLNVPSKNPGDIPGLALAPHGVGGILDIMSPRDEEGTFRHTPEWVEVDPEGGCDTAVFNAGYAVVTPLRLDMTDIPLMSKLRGFWDNAEPTTPGHTAETNDSLASKQTT